MPRAAENLGKSLACLFAVLSFLISPPSPAFSGGLGSGSRYKATSAFNNFPRNPQFDYLLLDPVPVTLLTDKGKTEEYKLFVLLELQSRTLDAAKEDIPRLNDAYLQTLSDALRANEVLVNGNAVDQRTIQERLTSATKAALGPDNVHQLLLVVAPFTALTSRRLVETYTPAPICCPPAPPPAPPPVLEPEAPRPTYLPPLLNLECTFKDADDGQGASGPRERKVKLEFTAARKDEGDFDGGVSISYSVHNAWVRMGGRFLYLEASSTVTVFWFMQDYLDGLKAGEQIALRSDDDKINYTDVYKIDRKTGQVTIEESTRVIQTDGTIKYVWRPFQASQGTCETLPSIPP